MDDPNPTKSYNPEPAATLGPPQVGRYRILCRIGAGGMGTVYRAEDPTLGRAVAVKVPHLNVPGRDRAAAVQRFLREARTAAQVHHPNVCPIHDTGEHDGMPFVVMPFVEGPTLAQVLRTSRIDDRHAAHLLAQVADGLAAIHTCGIVHRDLKPGNILLMRVGAGGAVGDAENQAAYVGGCTPLITDFGLARPDDDRENLTADGAVLGTPAYMSPEQARGDHDAVGPLSDVYALGVILYQALAGRLPFEGTPLKILAEIQTRDPLPLVTLRPDVDPALVTVVTKAMARQPERRHATARELAADLRRWLATPPRPDPIPHDTPREGSVATQSYAPVLAAASGRRMRVFVGLCCVALAAVAFAAWHLTRDPAPTATPDSPSGTEPPDPGPGNASPEDAYLAAALNAMDVVAAEEGPGRAKVARTAITYSNDFSDNMELPLVVGVLADLSGNPVAEQKPLRERRFVPIDRDAFNTVMERAAPRLAFMVPRHEGVGGTEPLLKVELFFRSMADFEPDAVARQLPALDTLLKERATRVAAGTAEDHAAVARLDRVLSGQVREILHDPAFQQLEATWRGLQYLVLSVKSGERLRVRVLNVTKNELSDEAERAAGFERTTLYKRVYEDEFPILGGRPYDVLVGNYFFGPSEADLRLLSAIADVAAVAQVPFVAAAHPRFFQADRFSNLAAVEDPAAQFSRGQYARWQEFRKSPAARFVALALPRVLARLPYGAATKPITSFNFEERPTNDEDTLLWMSAAWTFAIRVAEAHDRYGWPARVTANLGAPALEGLPVLEGRSTDWRVAPKQERALTGQGFLTLIDVPGRGPIFVDARSVYKPGVFADPNDQARDLLSAELPVLLCGTRFNRYLMVIARDRVVGKSQKPSEIEAELNHWLEGYTARDDEERNAPRKPLHSATMLLREVRGKPEVFEVVTRIRPQRHLTPIPSVSLELVLPLPLQPGLGKE